MREQAETVLSQQPRSRALVDLKAIEDNLARLVKVWQGSGSKAAFVERAHRPEGQDFRGALAMVKAQAYGHGAAEVGRVLDAHPLVCGLGVATVAEAQQLRQARTNKPILVFSETGLSKELWEQLERRQIFPVLHTLEDLRSLCRRRYRPRSGFHLKLNTGLNRLGLDPSEWEDAARLLRSQGINLSSLCTHWSSGETPRQRWMKHQLDLFRQGRSVFESFEPKWVHASATAAIAHEGAMGLRGVTNVLRPGLGLFGYGLTSTHPLLLKPAMRVQARVLRVRVLQRGEKVGYGGRFQSLKPTFEAILGIGYADGWSRQMKAPTHLGGRKVLGVVSMDLTAIEGKGLRPGDWVTLWGDRSEQAEALAQQRRTIVYEVISTLGTRVVREYHHG